MPIINKGTSFSNGEQLTADKINNLLDLATFNELATDSASTTVNSASQIVVADSGISTSKIADANVTKAKIEDVADYKVLGNVSGASAAPAEVSILDEDDMTSDSATALATQQSIKAYMDNFLGIKAHCVWDGTATGTNAPISGSGVTSVTRNAAGNWTINLSVTAPSASFTTLASSRSNGSSGGTTNNATGAYSTSTTTVGVIRESGTGAGSDGSDPLSFAAIW